MNESVKDHAKRRLIDVSTVIAVGLIFWAVYTGYVLMGAVNSFYTGQCRVVQDQALEQAVEEEMKEVREAAEAASPMDEGAKEQK